MLTAIKVLAKKADEHLLFALLAFFLIIRLQFVATPFFAGDEANYANMYFEFLKSGRADIYGELVAKPQGMFAVSYPIVQPLLAIGGVIGMPIELPFRIAALLFGAATIACSYFIFLHISGSKRIAALASAVFSIMPNFLFVSSLYYPDIFVMFFSLLSFLALLRVPGAKGGALGGLFMGIAFYIKLHQAFFAFAIIIPYMIAKKKIRLDYFAFCALFCALAAILIGAPYYPARVENLMLMVKMELFTRVMADASFVLQNASGLLGAHAIPLFLAILCTFYCATVLKKEDFSFELSQVAILLAYLFLISSFWYSAMLFFGLALLVARVFFATTAPEKAVFGLALFGCLGVSMLVVHNYIWDEGFGWEAQKELGLFLAGKYPITFAVQIERLTVWKYYEEKYLPENSPLIMANANMGILAYKSIAEGGLQLEKMEAAYYDAEKKLLSPEALIGGRYFAVDSGLLGIYAQKLGGYGKIKEFGGKYVLYEKRGQ